MREGGGEREGKKEERREKRKACLSTEGGKRVQLCLVLGRVSSEGVPVIH